MQPAKAKNNDLPFIEHGARIPSNLLKVLKFYKILECHIKYYHHYYT
jgi:hypothetical protein